MDLTKEYKTKRANLLRKASRARKKGIDVPTNIIPKIPKRITESSIHRIVDISEHFYEYVEAGKVTRGERARKPPEEQSITLHKLLQRLNEWDYLLSANRWSNELEELKQDDKNRLSNILDSALKTVGAIQVAKNIKNNALEVEYLTMRVLYESGDGSKENFSNGRNAVDEAIGQLQAIFTGTHLTVEDSKRFSETGEELQNGEEEMDS